MFYLILSSRSCANSDTLKSATRTMRYINFCVCRMNSSASAYKMLQKVYCLNNATIFRTFNDERHWTSNKVDAKLHHWVVDIKTAISIVREYYPITIRARNIVGNIDKIRWQPRICNRKAEHEMCLTWDEVGSEKIIPLKRLQVCKQFIVMLQVMLQFRSIPYCLLCVGPIVTVFETKYI